MIGAFREVLAEPRGDGAGVAAAAVLGVGGDVAQGGDALPRRVHVHAGDADEPFVFAPAAVAAGPEQLGLEPVTRLARFVEGEHLVAIGGTERDCVSRGRIGDGRSVDQRHLQVAAVRLQVARPFERRFDAGREVAIEARGQERCDVGEQRPER